MAGSDIRSFFGSGDSKPRSSRSKRKIIDEDDDEDDDVMVIEKPKKQKTDDSDDDYEELEASEFFSKSDSNSKSSTRSKRTPKKEKEPATPSPAKKEVAKSPAKKEVTKSPAASKPAKKESPTKKASSSSSSSSSSSRKGLGAQASDILQTIPDAPLPDPNDLKPVSFRDRMSQPQDTGTGNFSVPDAAENCLAGMTFVFTGSLPNLGRDDGKELVKRYGGKVTGAVSKSTTCVVLGENAGPKKIQTIVDNNIKAITEDGFAQLLSKMPPDGGDGELAQKAKEKRRQEEAKVEEQAKEMADQFKEQAKESTKKAKLAQEMGWSTNSYRDSEANQLWTVKYAPTTRKEICGNKIQVERLEHWLSHFEENKNNGFPRVEVPVGKNKTEVRGSDMRAVLISGPPGIGKTTAAHIIAKGLGYDVIESNASDTRSKKLLAETVAHRLDNTSLNGFYNTHDRETEMKNVCLIMDEVDGMSGGDRGGVGQMAALCRNTKVPIILVCNEKNLPKMRPFDKVTFDLPFRRPGVAEIRARIMSICHKEGLKVQPTAVDKMVESTRSDIRQVINMISAFARNNESMSFDQSSNFSDQWQKNTALRPFDITGKLLTPPLWAESNKATFNDKLDLYFFDHDFVPLFIQENYLNAKSTKAATTVPGGQLELSARAAESISDGDMVDRLIHGPQQHWTLMPVHGALSTVIPSFNVYGMLSGGWGGGCNFPAFLGNLSKSNKNKRLLQEIQAHMRLKTSCDKEELRQQYMSLLTDRLLNPLLEQGEAGIEPVMELMDEYYLTKEDWDVIMDLGVSASAKDKASARAGKIPTKCKSAFTRTYNSTDHKVSFMKSAMSMKAGTGAKATSMPDYEGAFEPEDDNSGKKDEEPEDDDDEDIGKDKYIKAKKPRAVKKASSSKKKK